VNGGIAERQLFPWEGTGTSIWALDNDIAFPTKRKMLRSTRSHICDFKRAFINDGLLPTSLQQAYAYYPRLFSPAEA
jgi:hypothetical protein